MKYQHIAKKIVVEFVINYLGYLYIKYLKLVLIFPPPLVLIKKIHTFQFFDTLHESTMILLQGYHCYWKSCQYIDIKIFLMFISFCVLLPFYSIESDIYVTFSFNVTKLSLFLGIMLRQYPRNIFTTLLCTDVPSYGI